jgi:hypothetical protein
MLQHPHHQLPGEADVESAAAAGDDVDVVDVVFHELCRRSFMQVSPLRRKKRASGRDDRFMGVKKWARVALILLPVDVSETRHKSMLSLLLLEQWHVPWESLDSAHAIRARCSADDGSGCPGAV